MARRATVRDAVAGFVTGLFSVPEGMAYASIGGFNPVMGLYAGILPTILGALFARTMLMIVTLTSAIALTSRSVLEAAGFDRTAPDYMAVTATLTLMVGVIMLVLGLLKAGTVMNFVSNAVMTGFTLGIALQIITGSLKDATGYPPEATNTIGKLIDWSLHTSQWQTATTVVAASTVVVWALAHLIRPLRHYAILIALLVVTTISTAVGADTELVKDIASIPNSLPPLALPDLSAAPYLIVGAFAVAFVALAQAAGISAAVPNPDGSRANASRDFLAQGIANVGGALTQALPTGGSLSRTGVATSAGSRTRMAGVFAGISMAVIVLLFGNAVAQIPMAVIGGLMIIVGLEILIGRKPDVLLVWRTGPLPAVSMVLTFLATTFLPLQQAILFGIILSLVLFGVRAAGASHLTVLEPLGDGRFRIAPVPEQVTADDVLVLHYQGAGLFAEVPQLEEQWPDSEGIAAPYVIFSVRGLPDVSSSTLLKRLRLRVHQLRDAGGCFMIAEASPRFVAALHATGLADELGEENIFPATDVVFEALGRALAEARRRRAESGRPGADT
jgi:SulP family sulfate permease